MKKRVLHILFTGIFIILGLPLLLAVFGQKDVVKPLKGVTLTPSIPPFTIQSWRNMTFQMGVSKYINQNFCFRPSLIRFYNQIEYSVFNHVSNRNIVVGKDEYLFERWFIDAYNGTDFIGNKKIDKNINKLIAIDSVLKLNGVQFIVTLAPGKPSVYPEKIPYYLVKETTEQTNYKYYRKKLKDSGITVFDVNEWFIQLKPDFNRNLFTKGGTHWSYDAALIVLDSLMNVFDAQTGTRRNKLVIDSIVKTRVPRISDDDLLRITNLLFDKPDADYYYPEYHFEKTHPIDGKLITISDSFFWLLYATGLKKSFKKVNYWYYFNTVYPESFKKQTTINDINFEQQLLQSDVVMLMASTSSLTKLGWGFINQAYDNLVKRSDKEKAIRKIIADIKNDPKWYASVKRKALNRNIELDSMLRLDAEYVYKRK